MSYEEVVKFLANYGNYATDSNVALDDGRVLHVSDWCAEIVAQQGVRPTLLTLCPECGVEQIVTHLPTCAHYVAQSG